MRLTLEYTAGKVHTSGKGSISGKESGIWKGVIYRLGGVVAQYMSVGVSPAESELVSWD